jgi:hypothetical protein
MHSERPRNLAIACLTLLATSTVFAGGPAELYGKWEGKDKASAVTLEFSPDTVVLARADASGTPAGARRTFSVGYGMMGSSATSDTFSIHAQDKDSQKESVALVMTEDENHIFVQGFGVTTAHLARVK